MKPYFELTTKGKAIFDELKKHLMGHELMDVDTYQVTLLAYAFDLLQKNAGELKSADNVKRSSTLMQMDKAVNWIVKISPKFGISPGDREKLKAFSQAEPGMSSEEKRKLKLVRG